MLMASFVMAFLYLVALMYGIPLIQMIPMIGSWVTFNLSGAAPIAAFITLFVASLVVLLIDPYVKKFIKY